LSHGRPGEEAKTASRYFRCRLAAQGPGRPRAASLPV
jgi:hypothetical protein